ncbi:MAG: IclR family transcriptional regulator [Paracoccaceae bacterium]|nr:IclR family transcriptional regulator [Paracoccaceae bacterium]
MTGTNSAGRILAILDVFSESQPEWTSEQLMEKLGYSRPTLFRYLKALREAGLVTSLSGGAYALGPRLVELDYLMRRSDPLIRHGRAHLQSLVAKYPCSGLLVRWYGQKLLCVASECSDKNAVTSYPRGRPMPLARGAISRVIMAFLPRRRLEALVDEQSGDFAAIGLGTSVDAIAGTLRAVRRDRVAVAHGEVTPGVIGVAGPVFDAGSVPIASLSVTISGHNVSAELLRAIRTDVRHAAAILSETLDRDRNTGIAEPERPYITKVG